MQKSEVSRVEILDHVADAFDGTPTSRGSLIDRAVTAGARPEVVQALQQLSNRRFTRPQELWPELPDVPIEN